MPDQAQLFPWNNQNLFSNNYLEYRLPETDLWKNQKADASEAFKPIKEAYESIRTIKLGPGEEAELENKFFQPVLQALGYAYHVQPVTRRGARKKVPDYALFKDTVSYKAARKVKESPEKFFAQSLTLLEAKYWGRRLNDTDKKDILDSRDPTAQTVKYLDSVNYHTNGKINWAILTNGKQWRLFYHKASSRSGNFFETDLEEIIASGDIGQFLYFYLFFSKNAFIPDPVTGRTWLDQHLRGAEEYARRVGTKLKDLIFDHVFEGLASGFIHFRKTVLSVTEETDGSRKDIFKGCLTLLYRLLFLLYAESRNLLPVNEEGYYKVSLLKLKKDIDHDLKTAGLASLSKKSYVYWARLESLFAIVAEGDPAHNVPVYNGGLFETPKDSFLAVHKMPDSFLADAIEKLTVDHEGDYRPDIVPFIDYSSLNVRHLGDIYEGLLEFHVRTAEQEIVEVREKGKSLWKKAEELKEGTKTYRKKSKGDVYIENSKHERKATGSYYTPHYIVEYIVKNTVGPILDERLGRASEILNELETLYKKQRKELKKTTEWKYWEHPGEPKGKSIIEIIAKERDVFSGLFDIKVLDPAMGSGHFLVHTVDFISDRIIAFLTDYPENPVIRKIAEMKQKILEEIRRQGVRIDESKLTEVNLIKRMVMKRCIYGVDLNEMAVELAKLSLWLDSFTLGAPLSFLDHHLKCGNSLVGVFDMSDVIIPGSETYAKVQRFLSLMLQISELADATISESQKSYTLFDSAQNEIEPIRRRLNVATARHFTDLGASFGRVEQLAYSLDFENEPYAEIKEKCETALNVAKERRVFHWRLEFPDVFYTEKGERENPGFDCVIGNPPYDVLSELEQGRVIEAEKDFYKKNRLYSDAGGGKLNYYRLFSVLALTLFKRNGMHGFIVPMALLADKQAKALREAMLKDFSLQRIDAFPQKDDPKDRVFEDAKLSSCIYIIKKSNAASFTVRIHPGKDILESSASLEMTPTQIKQFDNENLSIPSYPKITDGDFNLALKLKSISNGSMLADFASSQQGEVNLTEHANFFTQEKAGKLILRGAHINRYDFQEQPKQGEHVYLNVDRFLEAHGKYTKAYDFRYHRIGYQRGSAIDNWRRIIGTIIEKDSFCSDTINYIVSPKRYDLYAILALLNSILWEWRFRLTSTNNHVNAYEIDSMPMLPISFTTPEEERKRRVAEAVALYKNYMIDFNKGYRYEKAEETDKHNRTLESKPDAGRKEEALSGKHPASGKRVHGVRRRAGKPQDAERVSEDIERYPSTTRFIESSLGIKSYAELAPHLAKGVERVMASLLQMKPEELTVTPEFICMLHKDAFGELFPSWAGSYRDRNVTVSKHTPPQYFEVPVLMRQYCEDLESRLSAIGQQPAITDILLETLSFAEGRFLSIHPFLDFNGRVARMLLFTLLYRLDLPPVQLVPTSGDEKEKAEYLGALSEADSFNWQPLMDIWRKRFSMRSSV